MPTDTVRLTVAQAIVTYLSRQYSVADGRRRRLVPAALGIFFVSYSDEILVARSFAGRRLDENVMPMVD
jgi:hypothetical protein